TLSGTVYLDQAGNCELDDGTDTPAPNVMVVATSVNNDLEYHTLTNADGEYYFDVPAGDYRVGPITDPFQPFGECPAPEVTVGSGAGATADLFLPVLFDCANMTTSVSLPFLRRCFENFAFVDYRNLGSITAENATLTVTLDDFFVGAIPNVSPTLVDGNTYTFDLGDVPPFTSGQINFRFTVSCEAELGQSHCLESSVTPDVPCNPKDSWNGAMVNITDAECDGQEVAFTVANVGDNSMSVPLSYVVVEDGVMMTPRPIQGDALDAGVTFKVRLPANGTTYQLITNQEPDAPASEEPTALSEGCGTDPRGNFTTGLANIVELGNGVPSEAVACRENVGAYDPNDKNGFPRGFGEQGNIQPGTRLEFAIRFQNTGTDTAFNVVIRDQIAPEFDLKTFRAESASHPFTVSIDTNRMVTFTFADIMLPDSNVNLAGSQGVVNYSIDHDPDLQRGQDLHNLAGIYFDFNEPIITNETNHRIAKSDLPVGTRAELARSVRMDVFPNPTDGLLRVNLPAEVSLDDVLTVIDVHGRTLQSTVYGRVGNGLDVSGLPAGYYYLVLRGANDGLAKGRTAFVRK
ncbi:MAG: T9SS type A sorting domain-containing protein, partial [Bacteroidota bacterium]